MKLFFLVGLSLLADVANAFEKFDCLGTEPFWGAIIAERQITFKLGENTKIYSRPNYSAPVGTSPESVLSVQAKSRISTISGFIVQESDKAYCSDGMSERGFPYSIHLIVDGKAYTGCCSTASKPAVGQDQ